MWGVACWDNDFLASREAKFVDCPFSGYHNYQKYHLSNRENYQIIRKIDDLRSVYWYTKSGFWFEAPEIRLKKILTSLEKLRVESSRASSRTQIVTQILLREAAILASLSLLDFARSMSIWSKPSDLKNRIALSLQSGL
ncbi:MAG TPA: hypothetical protein VE130_16445 [Nitrososphaeraceae archaeon]|nr:hypothetical protein [Nitrososphaeraceae archaeon]